MSLSQDCPQVVSLASGLNMNTTRPSLYNQLVVNCCTSPYVICNEYNRVEEIRWFNMSLNGQIHGSSIPNRLQVLAMPVNKIYGDIPPLPASLTNLFLGDNLLNGSISPFTPYIIYIDIGGNRFKGNVPLIPESVEQLELGSINYPGNLFTGELILYKPTHVLLNYNLLTSVILYDTSLLFECDISDNPLLNHYSIKNLTKCIRNRLYLPSNTTTQYSSIMHISSIQLEITSQSIEFVTTTFQSSSTLSIPTSTDLISPSSSSLSISSTSTALPMKEVQHTTLTLSSTTKRTSAFKLSSSTMRPVKLTSHFKTPSSTQTRLIRTQIHATLSSITILSVKPTFNFEFPLTLQNINRIIRILVSFYTLLFILYKYYKLKRHKSQEPVFSTFDKM